MIFIIGMYLYLLIASYIDIKEKRISIKYLIVGAILSFICLVLNMYIYGIDLYYLFALVPGLILIGLSYITHEKIGYADGCMILFLGPVIGTDMLILSATVAIVIAGIFSGILFVFKKATKDMTIPFLPFLSIGVGGIYASALLL